MYAGQNLLVSTVITDFDGVTKLISPNVTTVVLDIADPTNTLILASQTMTYNSSHVNVDGSLGAYEYLWATPSTGEGAYRCRVVATGPNVLTKNYTTIRLRRNKDPFNGIGS